MMNGSSRHASTQNENHLMPKLFSSDIIKHFLVFISFQITHFDNS